MGAKIKFTWQDDRDTVSLQANRHWSPTGVTPSSGPVVMCYAYAPDDGRLQEERQKH